MKLAAHSLVRRTVLPGLVCALGLALIGCTTVTQIGTAIGEATGTLTPEQAEAINRSAEAWEKVLQQITPEQEYFIGRSVAATVLSAYKPLDDAAANRYVNLIGQTLAQASQKPETFGGYHFLIMDSEDVNAFAAPGGLVLISRGMLRCCRNEDELAAVLAHEIGHVENQHGLRAIKMGRFSSALMTSLAEAGKSFGGEELAEATRAFEGSITDITTTLMNSGYSRKTECQADRSAVAILSRVGYNPEALISMLENMKAHLKPGGLDFAKTHPSPDVRIAAVRKVIGQAVAAQPSEARQKRFDQALGALLQ